MRLSVLWRILGAQALSSFGTSMSTVALAFMVYQLTGSVLHMGAVMAVSTFPLVITSWIGGAFLDRFSAKKIMVLSDAARAVLIFALPFLAEQTVSLIYVIACFMGVASAFFNPGQMKLVGEMIERAHLVRANSYVSISQTGAELAGYLIGGVVVTAAGYMPAFVADAGTYVVSALLLLGLPKVAVRAVGAEKVTTLIAESPAVFLKLWRHPGLRTNLLMAVFPTVAFMMASPNAYGLALDVFDRGAAGVAALEVSIACGVIVGGILISRMTLAGDKNRYMFLSFLAMAVCLVGIYFSPYFWLSVGLLGLGGVANVGVFVPSITMFQEVPAEAERGRLMAVRAGFGQMGSTAGLLVGGVLGEALGITRVFLVAGVGAIILSLLVYVPYYVGAQRRAQAAWTAAMEKGSTRTSARRAAQHAALSGAESAWARAMENAALED
ncbi:MAG: MFS transporter [Actinobacteria bacterium]|nr:MFS transporter [Actinomycetota bacterium]